MVSPAFPASVPFHSLLLGTSSPERKLVALPRASGLAQPVASAPSAEATPAAAWDGCRGLGRPILWVLSAQREHRTAVLTWKRRLLGGPVGFPVRLFAMGIKRRRVGQTFEESTFQFSFGGERTESSSGGAMQPWWVSEARCSGLLQGSAGGVQADLTPNPVRRPGSRPVRAAEWRGAGQASGRCCGLWGVWHGCGLHSRL